IQDRSSACPRGAGRFERKWDARRATFITAAEPCDPTSTAAWICWTLPKKVFDAVELECNRLPRGFHIQAQIGDSVMVLSAMDPPYEGAMPASIYVYVPDVDATYQRALDAGATSITRPTDKPWRGRAAGVKDSFGNIWYIETYKG